MQQSWEATEQWITPAARVGSGGKAIHLQHDEPGSAGIDLAWPEEVDPRLVCIAQPPPILPCWLSLTQSFCIPVQKIKWAHILDSEASFGKGRRVGGKLHRDFFFLPPVTSRQFTPQRIQNQNLIKMLNK